MNEGTIALIEKLAEKLGTTTEFIWVVLVGQAKVKAGAMVLNWVLLIIATYVFYRCIKFVVKRFQEDHDDVIEILGGTGLIISGVLLVLWWGTNINNIETLFTTLFYPEGYALKEILRIVR